MANKLRHLWIPIYNWTKEEFLADLEHEIKGIKQTFAITPNPEMLYRSSHDQAFRNALNSSTWNLPDWYWLILWSYLESKKPSNIISFTYYIIKFLILEQISKLPLSNRICWSDVVIDICLLAYKLKLKIFLLWWDTGVADAVKDKLQHRFKGLQIVWTAKWFEESESESTFKQIRLSRPDIILLALSSPKQEFWIAKHLKHFPSIKFAIWLGWSFDFIIWKQKRAPLFLRKIWMEWLYRFYKEPSRYKRMYNATFWYLWYVYRYLKGN